MMKASHPGGESGKRRDRYTARKKYSLLATAQRLRRGGMSLNRAASKLHVSAANLSKWEGQVIQVQEEGQATRPAEPAGGDRRSAAPLRLRAV